MEPAGRQKGGGLPKLRQQHASRQRAARRQGAQREVASEGAERARRPPPRGEAEVIPPRSALPYRAAARHAGRNHRRAVGLAGGHTLWLLFSRSAAQVQVLGVLPPAARARVRADA